MFPRILALLGSLGVFASIFLPFEHHKDLSISRYEYQVIALWNYSPILAALLFVATAAYVFFLLKSDLDNQKKASYAVLGLAALTVFVVVNDIIRRDDVYWQRGFLATILSVTLIGFLTLPASAALCWFAAQFGNHIPMWLTAVVKAGTPSRPAYDPSLPKDAGRCAQCGQINSKAAKTCHNCGAVLPWAMPQRASNSQKKAASTFDLGNWLKSAFGNILTFIFCLGAPLLGYFLWKYLEKEDSPYAPTAIIASIMGIVFYVSRFAWNFIKIGSALSS